MNTPIDAPSNGASNGTRRRNLLIVTILFVILGVAWFFYWLLISSKREVTEDAYVGGDLVYVSARISGTVVALQGKDMELVQAGQVLVRLDTADADTQLQKAASALANAARQFRQQEAQAAQLDAAIVAQRLALNRAQEDLARREPLVRENAIAAEELSHARNAVAAAQATLTQTEQQAHTIHTLIDGTNVHDNPMILQAKSAYVDVWLAAQRNDVIAPVTGHITQHTVKLGQRIQPGQALLTIVPLNALWVDANFKEVQLRNLRIGQQATVESDLYGGTALFHGKVSGIGIGTGAAFALLPAQNASGNWIKVIQRVPVRIKLDPKEVAEHPLRIGLSATVKVDTHDRSGRMLAGIDTPPSTENTKVYATDMSQVEAAAERIIAQQL
ncbi:MAG: efflux RND transporter periplasmic adaptor subunit [Steroidobacteraceae bacterium]